MYNPYYKLDENYNAIPCEVDELVWNEKTRRVGNDIVGTKLKRFINLISFGKFSVLIEISTVFLGINHQYSNGKPRIFETMIFGGKYDQEMERYSTWNEAEEGHKRWVERISKSIF